MTQYTCPFIDFKKSTKYNVILGVQTTIKLIFQLSFDWTLHLHEVHIQILPKGFFFSPSFFLYLLQLQIPLTHYIGLIRQYHFGYCKLE